MRNSIFPEMKRKTQDLNDPTVNNQRLTVQSNKL